MSSPRSFKSDYQNGITIESELKPILEFKFTDKLVKTGRYDTLDYEGERCFVEIKSRTNRYDQYPTTLIQQSKFDYARKQMFILCLPSQMVYTIFSITLKSLMRLKPTIFSVLGA